MPTNPQDAEHPDPYAHVRPAARHLLLLLRAAFVDDGRGGPWLYVNRSETPGGARVFIHSLATSFEHWCTPHRMVMLTGDEALAYVADQRWASITDPTVAELRALADHAVTLHNSDVWAADPLDDACARAQLEQLDDELVESNRAAARAARWFWVEQWLQRPAR